MNKIRDKIIIIGHRGANNIAPENTLKSFKRAIELGADYIEFDIHLSKDDEIVIMHDSNTFKTTGNEGDIKMMTLEELKKLDCGEGEKIPTLNELINIAKDKIGLQIEIKAPGLSDKLINILIKNNLTESTIISSFMFNELKNIKKLNPNLKLGFLFDIDSFQSIKRIIKKVIKYDFYSIHPEYKILNKEIVDFAHENGIRIFTYSVNSRADIKRMAQMGVDGIITDDIHEAKDTLNNM